MVIKISSFNSLKKGMCFYSFIYSSSSIKCKLLLRDGSNARNRINELIFSDFTKKRVC